MGRIWIIRRNISQFRYLTSNLFPFSSTCNKFLCPAFCLSTYLYKSDIFLTKFIITISSVLICFICQLMKLSGFHRKNPYLNPYCPFEKEVIFRVLYECSSKITDYFTYYQCCICYTSCYL